MFFGHFRDNIVNRDNLVMIIEVSNFLYRYIPTPNKAAYPLQDPPHQLKISHSCSVLSFIETVEPQQCKDLKKKAYI